MDLIRAAKAAKTPGFTGCGKIRRTCFKSTVLYQGTTSVVP
jgi:hypothetical protein